MPYDAITTDDGHLMGYCKAYAEDKKQELDERYVKANAEEREAAILYLRKYHEGRYATRSAAEFGKMVENGHERIYWENLKNTCCYTYIDSEDYFRRKQEEKLEEEKAEKEEKP